MLHPWSEEGLSLALSFMAVVWPWLVAILGTLLITVIGAKRVKQAVKLTWPEAKPYVDDPNDALVTLVAARLKKSPEWVLGHVFGPLTEYLDALMEVEDAKK